MVWAGSRLQALELKLTPSLGRVFLALVLGFGFVLSFGFSFFSINGESLEK